MPTYTDCLTLKPLTDEVKNMAILVNSQFLQLILQEAKKDDQTLGPEQPFNGPKIGIK